MQGHAHQPRKNTLLGSLCAAATLLGTAQASAAETPQPAEPAEKSDHRLTWVYPRFRLWQWIATPTVTVIGFAQEQLGPKQFPDGSWDNGFLFDDALRSAWLSDSHASREGAAQLSNYLWHGTQYFPVVDSLVVPLVFDRFNTDVALQLTMLNWQVQGLTFLLIRLGHRTVGRARPSLQECERDPGYDGACDPENLGRTASFFSGHAAMAFAGAGLTCAHHQALPLYGHPVPDTGICVLTLATATGTAYLRIVADRHWSTDVLTGIAVGGALGYGLPWFLHYRYGDVRALGSDALPKDTAILPLIDEDTFGAMWTGLW